MKTTITMIKTAGISSWMANERASRLVEREGRALLRPILTDVAFAMDNLQVYSPTPNELALLVQRSGQFDTQLIN